MEIKDELRHKANELPFRPGVYIMKNAEGRVIYVGKSKSLHNRVSQYFQSGKGHNEKTARMVSMVRSFDYVLTDTEIEALALENKLIKLYTPRYNIKLKDGKSYPYIKVEREEGSFPHILVTRNRKKDKARYFGPYSGVKTPYDILEAMKRVLGVPTCKYRFPKDKIRPCVYSQIGQCCAPCKGEMTEEDYREFYERICAFLRGNIGQTFEYLKKQMQFCAENLQFETAALFRDRLKALERLYDRQKVVGEPDEEFDVVAFYEDEKSACMCVLYIRDGSILDTEYLTVGGETILDGEAVCTILCELYGKKEDVPREIYIDFDINEEERAAVEGYLLEEGKKVRLRIPEKGNKKKLCVLAADNARDHAGRLVKEEKKNLRGTMRLAALLGMEVLPERIEAVDISNMGNEEITAGFVTYINGEPDKKNYRLYKMRDVKEQDDYASMYEAVKRRLRHREELPLPDILFLDGGRGHVNTVKALLKEEQVDLTVYGMVKDDFHKTRALTDGENEISIAGEQAVYMLIYKIQEEVHRFTFGAMQRSKRKTLKRSSLEEIPGIGPKKAKLLLQMPGGLTGIKKASIEELKLLKGVNQKDALAVYTYFHGKDGGQV